MNNLKCTESLKKAVCDLMDIADGWAKEGSEEVVKAELIQPIREAMYESGIGENMSKPLAEGIVNNVFAAMGIASIAEGVRPPDTHPKRYADRLARIRS